MQIAMQGSFDPSFRICTYNKPYFFKCRKVSFFSEGAIGRYSFSFVSDTLLLLARGVWSAGNLFRFIKAPSSLSAILFIFYHNYNNNDHPPHKFMSMHPTQTS